MGDAYVTLPLGEDSAGYPEHSPSAPEQPHAFLPRPPATAPIGMAEAQPLSKFDVHVVEPTKSGNGYNAFVAYKVVCRTSMENYMSNDISMMRRFNHFVWLHVSALFVCIACCYYFGTRIYSYLRIFPGADVYSRLSLISPKLQHSA